jgi:multidrug efflux system outer membrane protein
MRFVKPTLLASAIAIASGCSQMPTYEKPESDLPQTVGQTLQAPGLVVPQNEQAWWAQFNDPQLKDLLQQALAHNSEYKVAEQRLFQARAALTQGRADRWPSVNIEAGAGAQQTSDMAYPLGQGAEFNSYTLGGVVSYEIDLWGRVSATNQRLLAEYQAMESDREALRLSVGASVAQAYFSLRALDQMVQIAKNTVQSRKENLQLRQRQYELGRLTQLAVQQAEVELSRVEIQLINLQQRRDSQRHALSLLVGDSPLQMVERSRAEDADANFAKAGLPPLPTELQSELLMRRPDIQAAEQRLIAANANIGAARAALFPKLSLNGLVGVSSESFDNLFDSDALQWRAQAGLTAPIFNAGALRAQVQISEAEQRIKLEGYQQTLRQAFAETLDALSLQQRSQDQLAAQHRQVLALRKTLDLAQKRFDSGYSSYLEVLDAQRSLFDAEVAMVETKLNAISANIRLYKAIGGHWQNKSDSAQS